MKSLAAIVFGVFGLLAGAGFAGEAAAQKICPVTGTPLASAAAPVRVQVQGFTFFVVDAAAGARALQAEPSSVFAALAKNGDAAEPVSQACPVMGNRVNPGLFIQKNGRRVYMCCRGCTKRVDNNWDATIGKLNDQAESGDPENLTAM